MLFGVVIICISNLQINNANSNVYFNHSHYEKTVYVITCNNCFLQNENLLTVMMQVNKYNLIYYL